MAEKHTDQRYRRECERQNQKIYRRKGKADECACSAVGQLDAREHVHGTVHAENAYDGSREQTQTETERGCGFQSVEP